MLVYALGRYTPLLALAFDFVPGFSLFRRPADATFLLTPLAGLCAAYLLDRWLAPEAQPGVRWLLFRAVFGFTASLAIAAWIADEKGRVGLCHVAAGAIRGFCRCGDPDSVRGAAAFPLERLAAALLVAGYMVADLGWNNGPSKSTALSARALSRAGHRGEDPTIAFLKQRVAADSSPTRRDRVELAGIDFHWPNASMTHRLENTLGYNPVRLRWYSEATGAGDHVALPDQRKFSPLFPSYRSRLADLLGLRYIASRGPIEDIDPHLEPGALPVVAKTAEAVIAENPAALPRVMFATQWQVADFVQMTRTGIWPGESNDVVLLERPPAGAANPIRRGARRSRQWRLTGTPKCSSMCRRMPENSSF